MGNSPDLSTPEARERVFRDWSEKRAMDAMAVPRTPPSHATKPVEAWEGDYTFLHGAVVRIGGVEPTADPDDGPGSPWVLNLEPVPAVAPSDDEVAMFKAIWELADRFQQRGLARGSRVELALGIVLAMHEEKLRAEVPRLIMPKDMADDEPWKIDPGQIMTMPPDREPRFSIQEWRDIANSLEATAKRTYEELGPTTTIPRLNFEAALIRTYLMNKGVSNHEDREQALRQERGDDDGGKA